MSLFQSLEQPQNEQATNHGHGRFRICSTHRNLNRILQWTMTV